MPNLSALSNATTAATSLSNLILVTPGATKGYQPQNPSSNNSLFANAQQPPSFLFHYEGEQVMTLESDITDHFVEDNTAVADQIALKPEMYTTHGFIGELNDVVPGLLKPVKFIADKLTTIGAYAPELSLTALIAYQEAFFLYQTADNVLNSAVAAWSSISGLFTNNNGEIVSGSGAFAAQGVQNKQQDAFQQFYGYWRTRTLFTIQTPWAIFDDMAIKSLRAIQDAETDVITDFEITFKKIRKAQSSLNLGDAFDTPSMFQGRSSSQASSTTDQGTSSPSAGPSLDSQLA